MRLIVLIYCSFFLASVYADTTTKEISCAEILKIVGSDAAITSDTTILYDTTIITDTAIASDTTITEITTDTTIVADTVITYDTSSTLQSLQQSLIELCACDSTGEPAVMLDTVAYTHRNEMALSIKGLGSPMSKTGNILAKLSVTTDFTDVSEMTNSFYGGWEATSDSTSDYKFGGSSNMSIFMGGKSKERFTSFINFSAFRDTKKGISDQEDLILGGGVALIGKSFRTGYILKYSVGLGGKFQSKLDEFDSKLPREQSPIIDNRLKLKIPFFKSDDKGVKYFSYDGIYRHVHALNDGADYQFSFGNKLLLNFQNGYGLFLGYLAEYDNESTKENWTDLVSVGFSSDLKFGKRQTQKQ